MKRGCAHNERGSEPRCGRSAEQSPQKERVCTQWDRGSLSWVGVQSWVHEKGVHTHTHKIAHLGLIGVQSRAHEERWDTSALILFYSDSCQMRFHNRRSSISSTLLFSSACFRCAGKPPQASWCAGPADGKITCFLIESVRQNSDTDKVVVLDSNSTFTGCQAFASSTKVHNA
jgi:hypothetical protein